MKYCLLAILVFTGLKLPAQPVHYTTANAHSHNDYRNPNPFWTAYQNAFGSIEADIFLSQGELIVAHDTQELKLHRTLEEYYIQPVLSCIQKNNGYVYADTSEQLQLLIDIKADSVNTLDTLIDLIEKYPILMKTRSLKWVISGNRPAQDQFSSYPGYIWFDGELRNEYSQDALSRIAMLSDNFAYYSGWQGSGEILQQEKALLQSVISKARRSKKTVRFWNTPDNEPAWKQFMNLQVNFINTDHINALSAYLKRVSRQ